VGLRAGQPIGELPQPELSNLLAGVVPVLAWSNDVEVGRCTNALPM
jgi:hypothetical protein